MAEKSAITFLSYLKVEGGVDCEVIDEKGYKMEKEYIKPEAEMMKFVETEEIMATENNLFTATTGDASMDPLWIG